VQFPAAENRRSGGNTAGAVFEPTFGEIHLAQVLKALPFEPPTQVAFYGGKASRRFDWQEGAEGLYRYLTSCTAEMQEGVRALGKTAIAEVNRNDLVALDELTSQITGLPLAYSRRTTRARTVPGAK